LAVVGRISIGIVVVVTFAVGSNGCGKLCVDAPAVLRRVQRVERHDVRGDTRVHLVRDIFAAVRQYRAAYHESSSGGPCELYHQLLHLFMGHPLE